ncbi:FliI/YscN family ATPase [Roseobacteraceae bacterium S113]
MDQNGLETVLNEMQSLRAARPIGRVLSVSTEGIRVVGLGKVARLGDLVAIPSDTSSDISGEIISLERDSVLVLPSDPPEGIAQGDKVMLNTQLKLFPNASWIGRVIDPNGKPLDGRPLSRGAQGFSLFRDPPNAVFRKPLGERLNTGLVIMNTLLPIALGQRIGLFAGSGVGKTSLLGHLAKNMQADVVVVALIGERGREVGEFVQKTLGPDGLKRTVVVAATSDQSALARRQCAATAMTVAEYFRDQGLNVLYLADSITRLAEAHREVAVAAGEPPSLRGHPPSMTHMITSLCERAGPGVDGSGNITAVFTVLVAGSDMDEPVADTLRGVLDGHIVLEREIAERGRYPAIDVVKSVSRCLPDAATETENAQINKARKMLGAYARSETMIRAGLYAEGSDPVLDQAVRVIDDFEVLMAKSEASGIGSSFVALNAILRAADAYSHATMSSRRAPA